MLLKQEGLAPVYLFYGKEAYLVRLYSRMLKKKAEALCEGELDFTLLEEETAEIDEVFEALRSISLLGGTRMVQLDGTVFDKLSSSDFAKLLELLENPAEEAVLLITQAGKTPDKRRGSRWSQLLALAEKNGVVAEFAPRTEKDLVRFVGAVCAKRGVSISAAAAQNLVSRCGDDMLLLQNEAEKLCAYRKDGEITKQDIELLVASRLEENVFELSKKLIRGDLPAALGVLQNLFDSSAEPVAILGAFNTAFVDLYRCKLAEREGKNQKEIIAAFGYKGREFRVSNAMRDMRKFTLLALEQILDDLALADYQIKSTKTDPEVILQKTLLSVYLALYPQEKTS